MGHKDISQRKTDHIDLAFAAQSIQHDNRFNYEPMLAPHPDRTIPPLHFAGKTLEAPIWISSMTGGADHAAKINRNLAAAAKEFGLGMGLGSCRALLENEKHLKDFAVRKYMGDQPLFANLGIAQVENLLEKGKSADIRKLVERLEADGLIVHVNPLQEWMQPEGDRIKISPLETIKLLLSDFKLPLIVKEVGQGFGPESLRQLAGLPLEAIDFGAYGGTNFSLLEAMRAKDDASAAYDPLIYIGHTADEMTTAVAALFEKPGSQVLTRGFIISGGIRNYLDGYYYIKRIPHKALYGQAAAFLKPAMEGEKATLKFAEKQIQGLSMAYNYLTIKE